jgi:hypothetical protein
VVKKEPMAKLEAGCLAVLNLAVWTSERKDKLYFFI